MDEYFTYITILHQDTIGAGGDHRTNSGDLSSHQSTRRTTSEYASPRESEAEVEDAGLASGNETGSGKNRDDDLLLKLPGFHKSSKDENCLACLSHVEGINVSFRCEASRLRDYSGPSPFWTPGRDTGLHECSVDDVLVKFPVVWNE